MGFIIKPLVTEKMTKITDKSSVERTYKVKGEERTKKAEVKVGFIVKPEANKVEIKKEVEGLYNVTVLAVNTVKYAGKRSSRYTKSGLVKGQKNAYKKAIVTLKEGDSTRILLHPCQRSLSFTVSVLPAVETTPVR